MRHCKTACFETLVLEPHFAQSCGRFLLLYCLLGWQSSLQASFHWKMQNVKLLVCPTPAGCICSNSGNLLGRSAKHRKLKRCVAAQHAMLRACCVCVAYDKTHATLQIVDKLLLIQNYQQNRPNTVNFTDSQKTVRRKASETLTSFFCLLETSKASPSTKYRPTPDREAFNHKTLRLQIQPARHPQMRPQHHVQPLTNPPGHAQEPHERYRCKTTDNNKTYCSNPPTACNRNYTRRRTETK